MNKLSAAFGAIGKTLKAVVPLTIGLVVLVVIIAWLSGVFRAKIEPGHDAEHDPTGLAVNDSLLDIVRNRGYQRMQQLLETKLAELHGDSSEGGPASVAIRAYDLAQVRSLLVAAPHLVHAGDARGNRPIHWAVMTRQIDTIDELLTRGANINAKRIDGARPIQLTNGDYHYRGWRDVPKD